MVIVLYALYKQVMALKVFTRIQVPTYYKPAGCSRFPIEAPRRHMRLESSLKGRDELLKLVER